MLRVDRVQIIVLSSMFPSTSDGLCKPAPWCNIERVFCQILKDRSSPSMLQQWEDILSLSQFRLVLKKFSPQSDVHQLHPSTYSERGLKKSPIDENAKPFPDVPP